jgi:hypothetical protein
MSAVHRLSSSWCLSRHEAKRNASEDSKGVCMMAAGCMKVVVRTRGSEARNGLVSFMHTVESAVYLGCTMEIDTFRP